MCQQQWIKLPLLPVLCGVAVRCGVRWRVAGWRAVAGGGGGWRAVARSVWRSGGNLHIERVWDLFRSHTQGKGIPNLKVSV